MTTKPPSSAPALLRALPFWVVWIAMFNGVLLLRVFIGFPASAAAHAHRFDAISAVCLVSLAISTAVRWLLLPRLPGLNERLPAFIVGCALAEGVSILSLFLAPGYHRELYVLGVLALLQMAPLFTLRPSGAPSAQTET